MARRADAITSVEVGLYSFASATDAAEALTYFSEARAEALGLRPVASPGIGDGTEMITGALAPAQGNETTVYVGIGEVLARVSIRSEGDPTPDAVRLAEIVASNAGGGRASSDEAGSARRSANATAPGGCELVELYPGYPGYQGYVTGVDGVGDHTCLHDLVAQDPFFSRADEDRENKAAGRRLGLAGPFETWTWENWLAVEAERGMTPTCYACLIATADQRAEPRNTPVQPDDPRLLLGEFEAETVYRRYAAEHGIGLSGTALGDYQLRAIVGMANSGRHLNAVQLLEAYEATLDGMFTPGRYLSSEELMCGAANQGGYFPVPPNAAAEDQLFAMALGVYGLEPIVPTEFYRGFWERFEVLMRGWQEEHARGGQQSFAEYLRDAGFGC